MMRGSNPHASKARGQPFGRPLPPLDRAPGAVGQAERKLLDRDGLMLVVAANELGSSPAARPLLRRQRSRARRPHTGLRQDAGDIAQCQRTHAGAQVRVAAIPRVHQHHAASKAGFAGRLNLLKRDLGLGLETDILRHPGLTPTVTVRRPVLRQIQAIGHRQARVAIGNRQRHRDLTVVLFAELAAILPPHPDRVRSLLGEGGVVDDPRFDRPVTFNRRQHLLPHLGQNLLIRPCGLADEMQKRLMLRSRPLRSRNRRHRFHALALARHHQAHAIIPQRAGSVRVAKHAHQPLDITRKSRFTVVRSLETHLSLAHAQP